MVRESLWTRLMNASVVEIVSVSQPVLPKVCECTACDVVRLICTQCAKFRSAVGSMQYV